jgi:hypothetical protein
MNSERNPHRLRQTMESIIATRKEEAEKLKYMFDKIGFMKSNIMLI